MKVKFIFVIALFGSIMCACSSADEPKYSCNPDVDKWVKENIDDIQTMTRANWLESDPELRLPIYRAFTPEQRIAFWRTKFKELKELSWSDGELSLIIEAEEFFENHLELFEIEKPTDEQLDDVELFVYKWGEKAKDQYSWTDEMVWAIIASGEKVIDNSGNIYKQSKSAGNTLLSSSEICNCHIQSSFTCMWSDDTCTYTNCTESGYGCGGLLLFACDGRCKESISYYK